MVGLSFNNIIFYKVVQKETCEERGITPDYQNVSGENN